MRQAQAGSASCCRRRPHRLPCASHRRLPSASHPPVPADSLTTPIVQTATYTFVDTAELIAYQEGRYGSYEYGRYGNPTTRAAEEKIRELEGAEDCLVSSSGMNAATTMLLALVPAGGHIVTTTDCYRRTRQFIQTVCVGCGASATLGLPVRCRQRGAAVPTAGSHVLLPLHPALSDGICLPSTHTHNTCRLPKMGISATVIDPADLGALEAALEEHNVRCGRGRRGMARGAGRRMGRTRCSRGRRSCVGRQPRAGAPTAVALPTCRRPQVSLFFSESPTNPYMRCVDIPRIKKLCAAKDAVVVVDSTFATPINQQVRWGWGGQCCAAVGAEVQPATGIAMQLARGSSGQQRMCPACAPSPTHLVPAGHCSGR